MVTDSPMGIIVTNDRSRWALLATYSSGLVGLGVALSRGVPALGTIASVNLRSPHVIRSVASIAWAPIAWNVFPRLEFRHRILSRIFGGNRSIAHYLFAAYILAFSSFREHLFFAAIDSGEKWDVPKDVLDVLNALGTALFASGTILSASGFYHLRIRFTYMGEYFGFRMPQLVSSFPFNAFPDPMYNGSVLMHLGHALRAASPSGFFLACTTGLSYWTAAKIFEEYVYIRFISS